MDPADLNSPAESFPWVVLELSGPFCKLIFRVRLADRQISCILIEMILTGRIPKVYHQSDMAGDYFS